VGTVIDVEYLQKTNVDIFKDIESVRHSTERNRELSRGGFGSDLRKLLDKHKIEEFTKIPNAYTMCYLIDSLTAMRSTMVRYLIHVNAQIMEENGETPCALD